MIRVYFLRSLSFELPSWFGLCLLDLRFFSKLSFQRVVSGLCRAVLSQKNFEFWYLVAQEGSLSRFIDLLWTIRSNAFDRLLWGTLLIGHNGWRTDASNWYRSSVLSRCFKPNAGRFMRPQQYLNTWAKLYRMRACNHFLSTVLWNIAHKRHARSDRSVSVVWL